MKAIVTIERGADGSFDATMEYLEAVPFGLLGQGATPEAAIDDLRNSYREALEMCRTEGRECPHLEFEFRMA